MISVFHRGPDGRPTTPADPLEANAALNSGTRCRVEYDDAEPDALGRRHFTLLWDERWCEGVYLRRAQCFHAVPANHFTPSEAA